MKRHSIALWAAVLGIGALLAGCQGGTVEPAQTDPAAQAPAAEAPSEEAPGGTSAGGSAAPTGDDNADDEQPAAPAAQPAAAAPQASSAGSLDAAKAAIATAEKQHGGTAVSIDLDDDNTRWEIETVEGDGEWKYTISTDGATVHSRERDHDDDDDDRRAAQEASISLTQALEKAHANTAGTIDGGELDKDFRRSAYDVTIRSGSEEREFEVDARTGDLRLDEVDHDD